MSALYARHTKFESKLDMTKDICLTINDVEVIIEFSYHGIRRGKEREVMDSAVTLMVQRAFDQIIDLQNDERFLLIDKELCVSIVGAVKGVGQDILISVVSALDTAFPHNPHNTFEIVV